MNDRLCENMLYVTMREWRMNGSVLEYFRERTGSLWVLSHNNFAMHRSVTPEFTLERYRDGRRLYEHRWLLPSWLPKVGKYVLANASLVFVATFLLPPRTWVVFHHPIFHFGTGWLERLKKLRFVFWPWDHFGKTYPDYFFFEGRCVRRVRYLLSVSEPMARVYDELWPRDSYSQVRRVLPLGVDAKIVERAPQDWQLGLVGNLRPEDGLLTTLDAMVLEPRLWLDVVGGGIHLDAFKKRAREVGVSDRVRFLGYVESSDRLLDIVSSWQVGLAPYHPTCYTAYADPGKIKHYLQLGLPIVTTSIVPMSEIVRQAGAGEAVPPSDVPALLAAIMKIRRGYDAYVRGVMNLRGRYEYRRLYDEGFSFMREPRE